MTFDYKKEYKEFYMPKGTPSIVRVPKMNYIAVRGSGNPNDADGEYKQSIGLLYGIAFTIKMSKKEDHQIDGYFDYVVPPLEGFWWQEGGFLLFACLILLAGKILTGQSEKLRRKRNRISPKLSSFRMMKVCVYSVCISDRMTMSLLQ